MKIRDLSLTRHTTERVVEVTLPKLTEAYVHTLSGSGTLYAGRAVCPLAREGGPLSAPPPGWLLSAQEDPREISLVPDGPLDVLVASVRCAEGRDLAAEIVLPQCHRIGQGSAEREVWEILGSGSLAQRLRVGETMNRPGGWSSWPPHSFDHDPKLAPKFEEIFLTFVSPKESYGMLRRQGLYHDHMRVDDAVVVRDGQMIEIPLGVHPITAPPDTTISYFWAYVSPIDKLYKRLDDGRTEYA